MMLNLARKLKEACILEFVLCQCRFYASIFSLLEIGIATRTLMASACSYKKKKRNETRHVWHELPSRFETRRGGAKRLSAV